MSSLGRGHVIEVQAPSVVEAVVRAVKLKAGSIATDLFRPIRLQVFEPKAKYQVKLKDFMAWLDGTACRPGK